jgi:hypothetical protein
MSWNSYFETVIPADPNLSDLDFVTINEFNHYISVIGGLELRNKANYDKKKEWQVYALLLEFLGRLRSVPSSSWGLSVYQCITPHLRYLLIQYDSDTLLPFHLVVETPDKAMGYTPKSDFHMCIKDFPHFLLKVDSQSNEGDHVRMLLQAACTSRIGNWLRASTPGKAIVIMAIYIDRHFKAHQHFLHQPDVGSTQVVFNWLTGSLWLTQYFLRLNTLGSVR